MNALYNSWASSLLKLPATRLMVQQLVPVNNNYISNVRITGLLWGEPNIKANDEGRVFMSWRHLGYVCLIILINKDNKMEEIALAILILNSSESCQFGHCDGVHMLRHFVKGTKYLRCNGLKCRHSGNSILLIITSDAYHLLSYSLYSVSPAMDSVDNPWPGSLWGS